jgi:hypothetical protein
MHQRRENHSYSISVIWGAEIVIEVFCNEHHCNVTKWSAVIKAEQSRHHTTSVTEANMD